MSGPAPDRFETVAWVYSPSDLAILLSLLGNEDIWVMTVGRGHSSVELGLTTALGGVELRVHHSDAGDARALLAGLDPIPYRAPLFAIDLLLFVLMAFAFAIPPPPRQIPCYVLGGASTT